MKIALVQQKAGPDKAANVKRGLAALEEAAQAGARLVCFAELAFERFHPQRPAAEGFERLAEPVPGPTTDALAEAAKRCIERRLISSPIRSSLPCFIGWLMTKPVMQNGLPI